MSDPKPPRLPRYDLVGAAHDYPDWAGPPRRSILLCSHQRSGSTMLGEALYFAGGLGCPLEYLHAGFRPGFQARWNVEGMLPLTHRIWQHRTDPGGTLSIKLFWSDIADIIEQIAPGQIPCLRTVPAAEMPPETYRAINDILQSLFPDPVYIHLERRDRLRQAISWFIAIQTNNWRRIPDVEDVRAISIDYNFDLVAKLISNISFCHAHWCALFKCNDIAAYTTSYEDLSASYAMETKRLLRALDHPGSAPAIRMERQSSGQSEAFMRRFLQDQRNATQSRTATASQTPRRRPS